MTRRRWLLRIAKATATLAVALALVRLWPHAPLAQRMPLSTAVWSADGELLRVTRASDDQYRMWVPLSEMSPALVDAVLLKEDRWFYWHPGVNPAALVRGAFRTYVAGDRQGGSTITMQLARLAYRLNTRTPAGKLRQIGAALWLEARYSKRELLEAYLNLAPFGGNIQGVGAASRIYFGKPPDRLTLGEALTLAVIPQRPSSRAGRSVSESPACWPRARSSGTRGCATVTDRGSRSPSARAADRGESSDTRCPGGRRISSTRCSPGRARRLRADRHHARRRSSATRRAPDSDAISSSTATAASATPRRFSSTRATWRCKAWVGSADYWNEEIDGQVNGVLAKRSPGSTLKPFVYALALDQGVLHPQTMLRDAPTSFGPFAPENFDGRFFGPITAEAALIRSRNIPAVWVATQLRQPSLYQFLQSAGIRDMKPESFYGLALPLGGGEVTMEELAGLYAMLANDGVLRPLRVEPSRPREEGVRLLSPEAAFITLDMLRRNPRPDEDGHRSVARAVAGRLEDRHVVGLPRRVVRRHRRPVRARRLDRRLRGAGQSGVHRRRCRGAAVFPHRRRAESRDGRTRPCRRSTPPPGVSKVAVCADSGDLAECRTARTRSRPGTSPASRRSA